MVYVSPLEEAEFTDRYGERRVIHRTRHGLKVKRTTLTPILQLSQAMSGLVGARVKAARLARGYSLAELCERAGIVFPTPKSRMWEIENAIRKHGVTLGTIYALAIALDMDVCELLPTVAEVRKIADIKPTTVSRLTSR